MFEPLIRSLLKFSVNFIPALNKYSQTGSLWIIWTGLNCTRPNKAGYIGTGYNRMRKRINAICISKICEKKIAKGIILCLEQKYLNE